MVAAEDDGHDATARDFTDAFFDVGVTRLGLPVGAVRVAEIDDFEPVEDLDPEIEVIRARLVGLGANGARTKARARSVGRGDVERCAHDGDVGLPRIEFVRLGQERPLAEGGEAAEHVAEFELFAHSGREISPRLIAPIDR